LEASAPAGLTGNRSMNDDRSVSDASVHHADARTAAAAVVAQLSGTPFAVVSDTASSPIGIVLGSGLGTAADQVLKAGGIAVPYHRIPGMPQTHVVGHSGQLVVGQIGQRNVFLMQGRCHHYEGWSRREITLGVRMLAALGIRQLIVTNAAGGIRAGMTPGDVMLIEGHLCLASTGPLFPAGVATCQPQSPTVRSTSAAHASLWSAELRQIALQANCGLQRHVGTYAMMSGPNYETPAEIRMLQSLGADAVGMSTVPEALSAALLGVDVLGVSCITNVAAGLSDNSLDHSEVTATATMVEVEFQRWIRDVIGRFVA
ncbi:MAG: purine-nucleoside phosphorylase, partial [Planctomycetaceae bacterium]|nr:purine-nucleoside phosphorylase [Planctomycetaceae bacterium]